MSPADKKRLEREYRLWRAKRGGDYSAYREGVRAVKSEAARRAAARSDRIYRLYLLKRYHPGVFSGCQMHSVNIDCCATRNNIVY